MSALLGLNGQPVNNPPKMLSPEQQILQLLTKLEAGRRMGGDHLKAVFVGIVQGGWQIGHDANLPASHAMVRTVAAYRRNVNGGLDVMQEGVVCLGDDYLPTLQAMAPEQEPETPPVDTTPSHHC